MPEQKMPPFITCLLLNMLERQLLLPNTLVAELLLCRGIQPVEQAPDWLIGELEWRGLSVPVISYAVLNKVADAGKAEPTHIVIINAIGEQDDLRFYALAIYGIPRTHRVDFSLASESDTTLGVFEQRAVRLYGETLYIPDFSALEAKILETVALD